MSYFDGLVNAAFKKTEDGKVAYYPWGVMGKGLVIPDEAHERQLRKFIKAFYMGMFPLIVCAAVFLSLGKHSLPEPLAWGIFISSPSV